MRILSLKAGHDGAVSAVVDGVLEFCIEPEKDSFPRHSEVTPMTLATAFEMCGGEVDVVALSGWHKFVGARNVGQAGGYLGLSRPGTRSGSLMGREVLYATSSHERSHVFMAAGMSSLAPLEECVVLVWEGVIGAFYWWREFGRRIERIQVMDAPGARYGALFAIADPTFPDSRWYLRDEFAGKLMAIAGLADPDEQPYPEEEALIQKILTVKEFYPFEKGEFRSRPCYNVGAESPEVARAARLLSNVIFEQFRGAAVEHLPRGVPLVVAGGCALNCSWNRRWEESELFSSVEAFPCGNDSGSSIGTAIDVGTSLGLAPRLEWSVYSGQAFVDDIDIDRLPGWAARPRDFELLAARIAAGRVVALVEGRAEMGPRALGHRSLVATPLDASLHTRLNQIKQREPYRPIAPCCLAEELTRWFDRSRADPYMLFFSRVKSAQLPAVTHNDGTARVQSVGPDGPRVLRHLLEAFSMTTGVGVLCNTSLNFHGLGFINRMSDLVVYAELTGIADLLVNDVYLQADKTT